jgi:hypothetical protein
MKIITIALLLLFILISGCASTYTIKDFQSKKEFYDAFNNWFRDRSSTIVLMNDSTISTDNGVELISDTLVLRGYSVTKQSKKLAKSDVKEIFPLLFSKKNTVLQLKDNTKIKAEDLIIKDDSVYFFEQKSFETKSKIASIDSIKKVFSKNRWIGTGLGFLYGTLGGGLGGLGLSAITYHKSEDDDESGLEYFYSTALGVVVGAVVGILTGVTVGYHYTYVFNE